MAAISASVNRAFKVMERYAEVGLHQERTLDY